MSWYWRILLALFVLHLICMSFYLHRVPGLLGDEGSEGENVYQILDTKQLTIYGERSYIGPLIDYVRIPFIVAFGYSVLPLRLVTLLFSLFTFWLAAAVFKKIFGEAASLYILAAIFFSPIYLLYQRLGWAITIIPFFAVLIVWLLQREGPWKYLWAGLAAGIGLHNHFIFLPTLIGLTFAAAVHAFLSRVARWERAHPEDGQARGPLNNINQEVGVWPPGRRGGRDPDSDRTRDSIQHFFLLVVGFLAGFGTQLAVLLTQSEDQGNPTNVVGLFTGRVVQLPEALPAFLSGSVFNAFYTGDVFAPLMVTTITLVLGALIMFALFLSPKKLTVVLWSVGTIIQLVVLVLIVDRFAARYFVMTALGVWGVAGYGFFVVLEKFRFHGTIRAVMPVVVAIILTGTLSAPAFFQFFTAGGSTNDVSISTQRREPAAAFVDIRPLLQCLHSRGPVYSENVHIYNRLLYLSHSQRDVEATAHHDRAHVTVDYRTSSTKPSDVELCPQLKHFQVLEVT